MTLLPPVVKPMTDSELYEATQKELAFFMDENTRLRDELTTSRAKIERLQRNIETLKFTGKELIKQIDGEDIPSWAFRAAERHRKNLDDV